MTTQWKSGRCSCLTLGRSLVHEPAVAYSPSSARVKHKACGPRAVHQVILCGPQNLKEAFNTLSSLTAGIGS